MGMSIKEMKEQLTPYFKDMDVMEGDVEWNYGEVTYTNMRDPIPVEAETLFIQLTQRWIEINDYENGKAIVRVTPYNISFQGTSTFNTPTKLDWIKTL